MQNRKPQKLSLKQNSNSKTIKMVYLVNIYQYACVTSRCIFSNLTCLVCIDTNASSDKRLNMYVLTHKHYKSFISFIWILLCDLMFPFVLKRLSQRSQANGFSPVWMRTCIARWAADGHTFPQKLHWCSETWNIIRKCYTVNKIFIYGYIDT